MVVPNDSLLPCSKEGGKKHAARFSTKGNHGRATWQAGEITPYSRDKKLRKLNYTFRPYAAFYPYRRGIASLSLLSGSATVALGENLAYGTTKL